MCSYIQLSNGKYKRTNMKFPAWLEIYGKTCYRGPCPLEHEEQALFFDYVRLKHPNTYGRLALHPANEGKRSFGQARFANRQGMTPGASDIIIPGNPAFVCEIKRRDHTKSSWTAGQVDYLRMAVYLDCWTCVALGGNAAIDCFNDYLHRK